MVVEGPVYALDTVVVRGAGCDPNIPTGVRLAVWPIGTQNYTELHAMGHSQSAVQPDGTVSATFLTSVLAAGSYYASLVCTGAIETNPATSMTVVAGLAPQASVTVTSARPGGTAVLTARHCGRSAHGEIQASARVTGPSTSFSFNGTTRADGTVEQAFVVPANTSPGTYNVTLTCGRNPAQTANGHLQVT